MFKEIVARKRTIIMTEYSYKGFRVFYDIKPSEDSSHLYAADGYVANHMDEKAPVMSKKFHTEHPTKGGAKKEIKKLTEDYIDFEWQEFHECADIAKRDKEDLQ